MRVRGFLVSLLVVALVLVACEGPENGLMPTPASPVKPTAPPQVKPTPSPAAPAADALMAAAVKQFNDARSYRFRVEAIHHWTFEGVTRDWPFTGEGAFAKPNNFFSMVSGPADWTMKVTLAGGKLSAWSARGEEPNPTLALGSPGIGAAPYTVINYLKSYRQAQNVVRTSIAGTDAYQVDFTPDLGKVSALDESHKAALAQVTAVQGRVWIDPQRRIVQREWVKVDYRSPQGHPESTEITLTFSDYNKPVEIR